jgi:pectate lyase
MLTRLLPLLPPLLLASAAAAADLPAFPGAEGFGALATGGRSPDAQVVRVTTLDDAGPGSLRDALSKPNRIVVFAVGGTIKLKSNLAVQSHTSILGQTAPGQGICLYGKSLSISGTQNVVLRYLRCRMGIDGDRGKCSINASDASNFIIDHCSIQWGRWDALGITSKSHDATVQHCIIGEAIDPQRFGALVDSVENITLAGNLWINNQSRNPKAKGTIQYINNVVYNFGGTGLAGGHSGADHALDAINNYLIAGPSSKGHAISGFSTSDHVFDAGNLVDLDKDGALNGRPVTRADYNDPTGGEEGEGGTGGVAIPGGQNPFPTFVAKPWAEGKPPVPVTVLSAPDAFKNVVAGAGASLRRDSVDTRLIAELSSLGKDGKIIKSDAEVGGAPTLTGGEAPPDADNDGLPDAWESARGLNPHDPADATKKDPSGYLMIELYANSLLPAK